MTLKHRESFRDLQGVDFSLVLPNLVSFRSHMVFFLLLYLFIYVFIHFWLRWVFAAAQAFLQLRQAGGCSLVVEHWLLTAVASLAAECRL